MLSALLLVPGTAGLGSTLALEPAASFAAGPTITSPCVPASVLSSASTYTVPAGANAVRITLNGAPGGSVSYDHGDGNGNTVTSYMYGGSGSTLVAQVPVTAGQQLQYGRVDGGAGGTGGTDGDGTNTQPSGGDGGWAEYLAVAGSDCQHVVSVAGGGGGAGQGWSSDTDGGGIGGGGGDADSGQGAAGGGNAGDNSAVDGGGGGPGDQSSGGGPGAHGYSPGVCSNGNDGAPGGFLTGGQGGSGHGGSSYAPCGRGGFGAGGGGAGYYGGGGGGSGYADLPAGGGGSSFVDPSAALISEASIPVDGNAPDPTIVPIFPTTTTVSVSPAPALGGQPVTLTVTVTRAGATSSLTGGQVTFLNGDTGQSFGTAPVVNGVAQITFPLSLGHYLIGTHYQGYSSNTEIDLGSFAQDLSMYARASSSLAVALSSETPGVCTVSGSTVSIVAAGPCTLDAAQSGSVDYNPASPVQQGFVVSPKTLTVTAGSPTMTYGATVPAITPGFAGFVNGDGPGSLATAPTCGTTESSTSVGGTSVGGTYATSCSGAVDQNYTIGYVQGTPTVTNPAPSTSSLSPASAMVSGAGFTLQVHGGSFVPGVSQVDWNGAALSGATYRSGGTPVTSGLADEIDVPVPSSDLNTAGTDDVTVVTAGPGGGTSNPQVFYVTPAGAAVTAANVATSTSSSGTATATVGGTGAGSSGSVTAAGSGQGTVAVAQYAANPETNAPATAVNAYVDVNVSPGNSFSGVTITDCNLAGGSVLFYWTGSAWSPVPGQTYSAGPPACVTATISNTSILAGTPFAVSDQPAVVTRPNSLLVQQQVAASLQVSAKDPEGDNTVTVSASGLPIGLSLGATTCTGGVCSATISGAATATVGTYSAAITAIEKDASTATAKQTLTVYVDTNLSGYPKLSSGAYNLNNATLRSAYLVAFTLAGANGTNAIFAGANLSGANLSSADLTQANLSGANLSNANLTNANLSQANLKGATGMKTATLTGVTWSNTTCPDGTISTNDGGTCLGHL